ncbi:MAG: C4-dicarboxylate ABC transporter [bacterium]|nr:C4-dicarboxylate ABC transporter [bacterium]
MSKPTSNKPAHNRLEHFPINIFALIMGLGGFGIATHKLETTLGWTDTLSMAAVIFASGMFLFLLAIYLLKLVRYPAAVRAEWNHPIKLSFFPAISISMLILSICFLAINKQLSLWVWINGATIQLITALSVIRYWIKQAHFKEQHLNPAWFIPAVGNILVPVAGMAHGFTEISWFFFSFGLLFWIILQAIIFNRLIFHTPLPERLLPTLFILIAPPAVGFLSYTTLTNATTIDPFAHFLYYASFLFFLLLATKFNLLAKLKFGLPWWAYSFPMAALTMASFKFYELSGLAYMKTTGIALYGITGVLIFILLLNTLKAAMQGKICVPE